MLITIVCRLWMLLWASSYLLTLNEGSNDNIFAILLHKQNENSLNTSQDQTLGRWRNNVCIKHRLKTNWLVMLWTAQQKKIFLSARFLSRCCFASLSEWFSFSINASFQSSEILQAFLAWCNLETSETCVFIHFVHVTLRLLVCRMNESNLDQKRKKKKNCWQDSQRSGNSSRRNSVKNKDVLGLVLQKKK